MRERQLSIESASAVIVSFFPIIARKPERVTTDVMLDSLQRPKIEKYNEPDDIPAVVALLRVSVLPLSGLLVVVVVLSAMPSPETEYVVEGESVPTSATMVTEVEPIDAVPVAVTTPDRGYA